MLAGKHRFNVLSNKGFSVFYRGKTFLIKVRPNNLTFQRFGVFLTKKNVLLASQRNALKRLIFDFVDKSKDNLASRFGGGRDFLIIPLAKFEKIDDNKPMIKQELKQIFNV